MLRVLPRFSPLPHRGKLPLNTNQQLKRYSLSPFALFAVSPFSYNDTSISSRCLMLQRAETLKTPSAKARARPKDEVMLLHCAAESGKCCSLLDMTTYTGQASSTVTKPMNPIHSTM